MYPKVDAYMIFKKEYQQLSNGKNEDKSENAIQNEWSKLSKELKKLYNINAEKQNKLIKECFNALKLYNKKKEGEEKNDNNKKEKKDKKQNQNE